MFRAECCRLLCRMPPRKRTRAADTEPAGVAPAGVAPAAVAVPPEPAGVAPAAVAVPPAARRSSRRPAPKKIAETEEEGGPDVPSVPADGAKKGKGRQKRGPTAKQEEGEQKPKGKRKIAAVEPAPDTESPSLPAASKGKRAKADVGKGVAANKNKGAAHGGKQQAVTSANTAEDAVATQAAGAGAGVATSASAAAPASGKGTSKPNAVKPVQAQQLAAPSGQQASLHEVSLCLLLVLNA